VELAALNDFQHHFAGKVAIVQNLLRYFTALLPFSRDNKRAIVSLVLGVSASLSRMGALTATFKHPSSASPSFTVNDIYGELHARSPSSRRLKFVRDQRLGEAGHRRDAR